jgi:cobalt-zinc-cadmium efflux system membrane fusion protein
MNGARSIAFSLLAAAGVILAGCEARARSDPAAEAPPPAIVEQEADATLLKVDHPERFPVAAAGRHAAAPELNVTGVVGVDVSRQVPVPSLATGRILEVDARLGDQVKKGQLLFKVQSSDIAGAYSDYRKAVRNEQLAADNERLSKIQLDRAKLLFEHGAVPKSALEIAENAENVTQTALQNARVDIDTTTERLRLLGADPGHPGGVIAVFAPVSGTVTDQQITNASGVQALTPPNPFTISDLSHVWIVCDVYENNLAQVQVGEFADIHLVAYPSRVFRGRISNILPVIDPAIRTAKVRLEVDNPDGLLRIGMFVTATFHGMAQELHAMVPANAVLHLHDRDWVYEPAGNGRFRRLEVTGGPMLPGGMQEIISGIKPGQPVVSNALVLQNTAEQ